MSVKTRGQVSNAGRNKRVPVRRRDHGTSHEVRRRHLPWWRKPHYMAFEIADARK
jgi:hypothetical protein